MAPIRPSGLLVLAPRERPVAAEEQADRERRSLDPVLRQRALAVASSGAKMSENSTPPSSSDAARGASSGSAGPASAKQRTTGSWSSSIALWSCWWCASSRCSCAWRCGA